MKTVVQRVKRASVSINDKITSKINAGLLVLIGIEDSDGQEDIDWLVKKIVNLRVFDDEQGVMNRSLLEIKGEIMIVSQFTLHASVKKGNRPSYIRASKPDIAIPLYEAFCNKTEEITGQKAATGIFGENMQVELINDGPVTIVIDTKNKE
ncbi:MAG: D-tyrosyl-tRNA(Tyr) deacylase [Tannerellaceae bacterium]|jgi:D-tyrosyl-tRNA(Tyr) deacylase|nr:D-tyrosyl-tRNA(Tyr) deacylase [Tannerellaceae bacterium]